MKSSEVEQPRPADRTATAHFEAIYLAHGTAIRRYAARRVPVEAVDDVVSEVFLIAWRRWGDYHIDDVRLWLFGVAHNVVANQQRSLRRQSQLRERAGREATSQQGEDPATAVATRMQVLAVLASLSQSHQEALRLIEWDRLSIAEAARVTQCSQATFRVRLHRARRQFTAVITASWAPPSAGDPPPPARHDHAAAVDSERGSLS